MKWRNWTKISNEEREEDRQNNNNRYKNDYEII